MNQVWLKWPNEIIIVTKENLNAFKKTFSLPPYYIMEKVQTLMTQNDLLILYMMLTGAWTLLDIADYLMSTRVIGAYQLLLMTIWC